MRVTTGKNCSRLVVLVAFLAVQFVALGQEHLTFMGYPITGEMKTFVKTLESDGLWKVSGKGWFPRMKSTYMKGYFWNFSECDIVVRKPKRYKNVTSVYIHPHNNFLLLNQLIDVLDSKYGQHEENYSDVDVNALTYTWELPEGVIQIFGTTVYGQGFDILYRDYVEVDMLNHIINSINNDL